MPLLPYHRAWPANPDALNDTVAHPVSAAELFRVYSQNLILGANPDQRFLDRPLLITGLLAGMNRRADGRVLLELGTRAPEGYVYAEPAADAQQALAALPVGGPVRLLCRGNGVIAGSPMLRECRLA